MPPAFGYQCRGSLVATNGIGDTSAASFIRPLPDLHPPFGYRLTTERNSNESHRNYCNRATVLTAVLSAGVALAPAASASAHPAVITSAVLVNYPAPRVCTGHRFTVGVFRQPGSGGSHAYRVSVYNPAHQRILYRHGYATSHWKRWRIRTTKAGTYHTIYHADGIRVRYPTRAHSCG